MLRWLEISALAGMIVFAIASVQAVKLRRAVVYLGVFSMLSSFVYLQLGAPDVAIAEAAIGCTIATVLYLIALKKYKVYTIYFLNNHEDRGEVMNRLETMLAKNELEPQVVFLSRQPENIRQLDQYDLMVERMPEGYYFYSHPESYHEKLIEAFVKEEQAKGIEVEMIQLKEEEDNEG